jgi:acyl transferase domain-containing protein
MATRIAYLLNLRGPAIFLDTACSTSLTAVHQACKSLLMSECNIALAGGITVNNYSKRGYLYEEGMIGSKDGHCRPFDAEASGTVGGEGVGIVVLKTLKNAIRDGDPIRAVIKGSGINNDGNNKVGYSAPSVEGQMEAIMMALKWAGVDAGSIGYVEAHGTATRLGDPVEVEALRRAFATDGRNYCALGSVKSNVGHLDAAAGVAGLIKTVMSLYHRQLPPSLHYKTANPAINFDDSPFYVNTTLKEWNGNGGPLRAGVSSFGIGGANVHMVLEEAPAGTEGSPGRKYQLLLLSGKTSTALSGNTARLRAYLSGTDRISLPDIAYTLQKFRKPFGYRRVLVCSNREEAVKLLSQEAGIKAWPELKDRHPPKIVFMFPGQGAQYKGMCKDLYEEEKVFRDEADRCFGLINSISGKDIRSVIYGEGGNEALLQETAYTQPALFVMEYALAALLMSWGISPDLMIGHSIGEYAAACISGIFSLEDAVRLVLKRGELMQEAERGAMLSLSIGEEELKGWLKGNMEISIAAVNSPSQCVVSGRAEALETLRLAMEKEGIASRSIRTSHAFHSHMMDPVLAAFGEEVRTTPATSPRSPFYPT